MDLYFTFQLQKHEIQSIIYTSSFSFVQKIVPFLDIDYSVQFTYLCPSSSLACCCIIYTNFKCREICCFSVLFEYIILATDFKIANNYTQMISEMLFPVEFN